MKNGLNLNQLAAEITRRAEAKKDFVVRSGDIHMTENALLRFGDTDVGVNNIAHQQVAEYADIPKKIL